MSYVWQAELRPGSGVFEDIIDLPAGDLAFQSANGTTFRVTPDLAGLSLRVKAVFLDAHGVPETVFSAPTAPVIDVPDAPPPTPADAAEASITVESDGVHFVKSDLDFILAQIRIAEAHAAGSRSPLAGAERARGCGLRTVDGSFNNLVTFGGADQSEFGAADNVFPRLVDPVFRDADNVSIDLDGPGGQSVETRPRYDQTSDFVFDASPRTISNLIVDQTSQQPGGRRDRRQCRTAASAGTADDVLNDGVSIVRTRPGLDGVLGTADDIADFSFENVAPDAGLSAPFNAWFMFFGQFFDHGLDLVTKGGSGTVFIPLQPDDPLVTLGPDGAPNTGDEVPPETQFMVLTRATNLPGPDGVLGTADDIHENTNTTSPFVDQNQTYTSHPSHQVFLRAYALGADGPLTTGKLIDEPRSGRRRRFRHGRRRRARRHVDVGRAQGPGPRHPRHQPHRRRLRQRPAAGDGRLRQLHQGAERLPAGRHEGGRRHRRHGRRHPGGRQSGGADRSHQCGAHRPPVPDRHRPHRRAGRTTTATSRPRTSCSRPMRTT